MVTAATGLETTAEPPDPSAPSAPGGPAAPRTMAGRIEAGSLPLRGRTIRLPLCGAREARKPSTAPALRANRARLTQPSAAWPTGAAANTSATVAMIVAGAGRRMPLGTYGRRHELVQITSRGPLQVDPCRCQLQCTRPSSSLRWAQPPTMKPRSCVAAAIIGLLRSSTIVAWREKPRSRV